MKLTNRQAEAIAVLVDLYSRSREQPIAYGLVAERLGVSPSTAYRMLRLAEKLGYVRAIYARGSRNQAGRSPVLFEPTDLAHDSIEALAAHEDRAEGFSLTLSRILAALASDSDDALSQAFEQILAGLDESRSPIDIAGRMIVALMICVEDSAATDEGNRLVELIARPATRFTVSTLGGMLLGLATADRASRRLASRMDRQLSKFQTALEQLSADDSAAITALAAQLHVALEARRIRLGARDTG